LTASVVKDAETGEFTIEAGALMLAVCIYLLHAPLRLVSEIAEFYMIEWRRYLCH
jgi:hypothetical protein